MADDLPAAHVKGLVPDELGKPPDEAPHGIVLRINHKWFVEFEYEDATLCLPVRADDAWNCDLERGSKVRLMYYMDDGGWRVVWKHGMKKFVKVSLDAFDMFDDT